MDANEPSEGEVRLADFLEQVLEQVEQGRWSETPGEAADRQRLLADLQLVLGAAAGLRAEQSQLAGDVLDLSATASFATSEKLPNPFPGEFRLVRQLGEGMFGQVWLADDLRLERSVALKAVHPASSPSARGRLDQLSKEARLLGAIEHPHVIRIHAWRESSDGAAWLVLQYVEGGSLADRVTREGPLRWQDAARYIADVGEGLLAVHGRGILHRDVKPANILWDPKTDAALLTDFGISTRLADAETTGGTPFYMPPEAFEGCVSKAQDVYGLAASLFWLVTGSAPFPGPTRAGIARQARQGLPDPDGRCSCLPTALEQVIRSGLSADPEHRPTLAEFVASLRATLNHLLADRVTRLAAGAGPIRLLIHRRLGNQSWVPVGAARPAVRAFRDIHLVPDEPDRAEVSTGERLRIEVEIDKAGYVTVFNIGPTGNLNRLHPPPRGQAKLIEPGPPLRIGETVLTPPTGSERLVAVWSREPLTVRLEDVLEGAGVSGPSRATRNIVLLEESVRDFAPGDWHVAIVELDHHPS